MKSTADRETFDRLMLVHLPATQRFAVRHAEPDATTRIPKDEKPDFRGKPN